MNRPPSILIVEHAPIIAAGLSSLLRQSGYSANIRIATTFTDAVRLLLGSDLRIIFLNPALVAPHTKDFSALRCENPEIRWIAVQNHLPDSRLTALFDASIGIFDSREEIRKTVEQCLKREPEGIPETTQELLSSRETEVLKLVVGGLTNKEIGERLHISIHTVITHRKHISEKTGIRSVSGLTLFAVVRRIISPELPG